IERRSGGRTTGSGRRRSASRERQRSAALPGRPPRRSECGGPGGSSRGGGEMFPLSKGKVSKQAHVGLPDGTYEEEHGREAFDGRASHLYRTHLPTAWVRIHGPPRPPADDVHGGERPEPTG